MSEALWAERVARGLLESVGARWRHTQGVAARAREVGPVLKREDAEVLIAAAYLHDVGYAPELHASGFHPLDGARFVRACGRERVAGLVAHHFAADVEAAEWGLLTELEEFEQERSAVSRALTYCDMTSDEEGRRVRPGERLRGIRERYGQAAIQTVVAERAAAGLLDDVRVIEELLQAARRSPASQGDGR